MILQYVEEGLVGYVESDRIASAHHFQCTEITNAGAGAVAVVDKDEDEDTDTDGQDEDNQLSITHNQ